MKTLLTRLNVTNATITSLADLSINDIEFDTALYPFIDALLVDQLELVHVSSIDDVPELNENSSYFLVDKPSHDLEGLKTFVQAWSERYPSTTLNLINIET